jgi:hypothetical protein
MEKLFFVFDVESVGLHGEGFSVGWVVVNSKTKETLEEGCFYTNPVQCSGSSKDLKWVTKNIQPLKSTHSSAKNLREAFWQKWKYWKNKGALAVADCRWPVEARFFLDCINDKKEERNCDGPYPFICIGSVLFVLGYNPIGTYERKENELPEHNALNDARQSARIFLDLI